MDPETKKLLADLNKAFEAFKEQNDSRLKQIETKGAADAVTVNAVEKANADISALQAQIRELETAQARVSSGPRQSDASAELEAKHASQFLSAVRKRPVVATREDVEIFRAYNRAFDQYLRRGDSALQDAEIRGALSVGSDPEGGYAVTPDRTGRMVQLVYESSPVRQVASAQSIGTDALEGTHDLDEAEAGWVGEVSARPETGTPKTGKWRIPVQEQYANPKVSQQNLDDASYDIGAWLEKKVAERLARKESTAFVLGNVPSQPRGFLTYPAGSPTKTAFGKIVQVNSGAAGAFAAADPGDKLIELVFGLKSAYRQGAVFAMSRLTVAEIRKLKDGQGNYLWQLAFGQQQGSTVLGYPIVEMEDMPAIAADSLSIAFGNFKEAYQIVDRQGIRVLRDNLTNKPWIHFYTTRRVGGDVVNFDALRIMKFAA